MAGDAEPAHDPLLARLDQGLQRPALGRALVQLVQLAHRMKLVQIQAVRPEPLERSVQLRLGRITGALLRLAAQEDLAPDPGHPRLQPQLGLTVGRGHVKVIDTGVQGRLDGPVRRVLVHPADPGGAECHHRAHLSRPPQSPPFHLCLLHPPLGMQIPSFLRGPSVARHGARSPLIADSGRRRPSALPVGTPCPNHRSRQRWPRR